MKTSGAPDVPPLVARVGPVLLFMAACAFGILEVHKSVDTWVALGVGQRIAAAGEVPATECFSYTAAGQPWVNQNWLAHLAIYWLYAHLSPAAVVWATWLAGVAIFVLVLLAGYWRTATWSGALLAAALAALGCRDFLAARPATAGLLLLAATAAMLAALAGQGERRRWWAVAALFPILVVWGAAHGSFVFGYGLLGLYVAHWLALRVLGRSPRSADGRQIVGIVAATAAAAAVTTLAGPFGIAHFFAGERAGGSSAYRQVSEWLPPWDPRADFPTMERFWWLLALTAVALIAAWRLGRAPRQPRGRQASPRPERPVIDLFDLGVVVLTLAMALWARRFAPLFYICSAPVVLGWVLALASGLPPEHRRRLRLRLSAAALLGAAIVAGVTAYRAYDELVARHAGRPELDLLERITRYETTPREALEYLRRNEVQVDLLVEWQWSGAVMFAVPGVRVFIDARAQQAFDEVDYRRYGVLMLFESGQPSAFLRMLDGQFPPALRRPGEAQGPRTDAVLIQIDGRAKALLAALEGSRDWVAVLVSQNAALFMRRHSQAVGRLTERVLRGEEWRPESGGALIGRGDLFMLADPPRTERALECWYEALRRQPASGRSAYGRIVRTLAQSEGPEAAREFVRGERERLAQGVAGLDEGVRDELSAHLARLLEPGGGRREPPGVASPPAQ